VGIHGKENGQRLMKFNFEDHKLLVLLLLGDLSFLILHLIHYFTSLLPDSLFSIIQDRGYAEFYQYMKELWILILFLVLGIKRRSILFIVLSLLFLYFLLDDSFELHERIGAFLAFNLNFQPRFGLRDVDFGELAVFFFFGAQFLLLTGAAYLYSDMYSRNAFKKLLVMLVFLAFFGVLIDMVQIIVINPLAYDILGIVDDAGEMFVMSVITWFVFRLNGTVEVGHHA
jgi:hypothetical protein